MNAVGTKGTKTAKEIPKWEAELWSYVFTSDGQSCPRYSCIPPNHKDHLCPLDVYLNNFKYIMDSKRVDPGDCDFAGHIDHCRVFKLIEKLANKYLDEGKVDYPPVPIELVSIFDKLHPIEIRLVPLKNHHGATWCLDDNCVIQLNSNDTPGIQRFTLFHESFHCLVHCRGAVISRVTDKINRGPFHEMMAERFSACILMPAKLVRNRWSESHNIDMIAEVFNVPKTLVPLRLKFLHLI